jgi:uncharacterized C2H2 Zn-finger protein
MILHLEQGTCESDADIDFIDDLASECRASDQFMVDERYWTDMMYQCPSCGSYFSKMSGLFQHVESDSCDETLGRGRPLYKFLRFLQSRL